MNEEIEKTPWYLRLFGYPELRKRTTYTGVGGIFVEYEYLVRELSDLEETIIFWFIEWADAESTPADVYKYVSSSRHSFLKVYYKLQDMTKRGLLNETFNNSGRRVFKVTDLGKELYDKDMSLPFFSK